MKLDSCEPYESFTSILDEMIHENKQTASISMSSADIKFLTITIHDQINNMFNLSLKYFQGPWDWVCEPYCKDYNVMFDINNKQFNDETVWNDIHWMFKKK